MNSAEHADVAGRPAAPESVDEQVRRKGLRPLRSMDELRDDEIWQSGEELTEFIAYLDASRHAQLG